jgi:quercetin dioxygenase-like cupin family protein
MCGLRQNEVGGGAVLLKFTKGARFPTHDHPGGEEVYVIDGRAVIGTVTVKRGDYLWTEPNGIHDLTAEEETVLFVSSPNGIKVVE